LRARRSSRGDDIDYDAAAIGKARTRAGQSSMPRVDLANIPHGGDLGPADHSRRARGRVPRAAP
jgi:hypothetical protein